ncbi:TetR/AcrR family transcriptional regulator [Acinetobacter baumannii]|uniref:TetR/AcrR family transcriptional regulator n=1 Tax=Acinetobacter calcoaceticus/baumannii complex TaxID=909768 RepID=UPI000838E289|nr:MULTISPECIES: TetR/AcrR family transcriptional regulator [Acinetobacter calcoaceticus/baumannii complex]HCC94747.1 TetR/AcrR family transcriptional regulator [Flavobacteriaceae bacterium]MDH2526520.1 TetR/AcrR family transcriptional regulator [Acinetobacter baumannii]MDV7432871.1 TetR/AcrR family transcriptional regulator [Acinetobacter baumannii]MDV8153837.1 TetR/AcrR family transcriptional regulator [Acinetobacter pittii]OCY54710.1 hypothetical protein BFR81_00870 [Acinetobacter pittii]
MTSCLDQNFTEKNLIFVNKIIETSKKILINNGYCGLTMRAIANTMNIHISTIQHYFKNKNHLIEYLFLNITSDYNEKLKKTINLLTDKDPLKRFLNFINLILDEMEKYNNYILFIELTSLSQRSKSINKMLNQLKNQYNEIIYMLIININPSININEYKKRSLIISMQTQAYLINFSDFNSEQKNHCLRNELLQIFSNLVTKI